jgi:hypothetical protein
MLPHARERCDRPPASRLRSSREAPVARDNFSFKKRQREMSKERKQEEKRQRKQERQNADQADGAQEPGDDRVSVNDGPRATN